MNSGIPEIVVRGRKKEPAGKRVTLSFKVGEAEAKAIDAACGGAPRSEWLRAVVLAAAGLLPPEPAPESAEPSCRHPKSSVIKGRCTRCRTFVGF